MSWQVRSQERRRAKRQNRRIRTCVDEEGRHAKLLFEDGVCIEAPARLGGAIGRREIEVVRYCERRGWEV